MVFKINTDIWSFQIDISADIFSLSDLKINSFHWHLVFLVIYEFLQK